MRPARTIATEVGVGVRQRATGSPAVCARSCGSASAGAAGSGGAVAPGAPAVVAADRPAAGGGAPAASTAALSSVSPSSSQVTSVPSAAWSSVGQPARQLVVQQGPRSALRPDPCRGPPTPARPPRPWWASSRPCPTAGTCARCRTWSALPSSGRPRSPRPRSGRRPRLPGPSRSTAIVRLNGAAAPGASESGERRARPPGRRGVAPTRPTASPARRGSAPATWRRAAGR